jgi:hypothetical protein
MCRDWIIVNVADSFLKLVAIADTTIDETALPDSKAKLRAISVRKSALNSLHGALNRDFFWRYQQMDVVRHDDISVEREMLSIFRNDVEKKLSIAVNLKQAATVQAAGGDEERSRVAEALRLRHGSDCSESRAQIR